MPINGVLIGIACAAAGVLAVDMVMFAVVRAAEPQRDRAAEYRKAYEAGNQ